VKSEGIPRGFEERESCEEEGGAGTSSLEGCHVIAILHRLR